MPLIVAATDFSAIADNAVNYACSLAQAQGAELMLLHSFSFPVMFSDVSFPTSLQDDTQQEAEKKMVQEVARYIASYPGVAITGKVIYGNIIDVLYDLKDGTILPWLATIGNSNTQEEHAWFESTMQDASKSIPYPLLAIPPQAQYKGVRKICFANDNKPDSNENALMQLRDVTMKLQAELHVYNATEDVQNKDNTTDTDRHSITILESVRAKYHYEYEADVNQAILKFIAQNDIDWLVMIAREHGFISGMFHKSHTKSIAHHCNIPMLMLHERHSGEDVISNK